ncbi:hypothetical protein [Amorphus orientalis]|nr:hypothetical protein [Amorphus orientalis]
MSGLGVALLFSVIAAFAAPAEHRAEVGLWLGPDVRKGLDAGAIAPLVQSEILQRAALATLARRHSLDRLHAALPAPGPIDPVARLGSLFISPALSSDERLVDGLSRRLSVAATGDRRLVITVVARDPTIAADAAGAFAGDLSSRLEGLTGAGLSIRQTAHSVEQVSRFDDLTLCLAGLFAGTAVGAAFAGRRAPRPLPAGSPSMPVTASLPAKGTSWVVARRSPAASAFPLYPGEDKRSRALANAVWTALENREEASQRLVLTGAKAGRRQLASELAGMVARNGGRALVIDLADDLAGAQDTVRAGFRDLAAGLVQCDAVIVREASSGVHFMGRGFSREAGTEETVPDVLAALESTYDLVIVISDEQTDADPVEAAIYRGAVALIVAHRSDARIWPRLDTLTAAGVADALLCPLERNKTRI